jgi:hypothetical protein
MANVKTLTQWMRSLTWRDLYMFTLGVVSNVLVYWLLMPLIYPIIYPVIYAWVQSWFQ